MKKIVIISLATCIFFTGCQGIKIMDTQIGDNKEISVETVADDTSSLIEMIEDVQTHFVNEGIDKDDSDKVINYINEVKSMYLEESIDQMVSYLIDNLKSLDKTSYDAELSTYLSDFTDGEKIFNDESYNELLINNTEFNAFVNRLNEKGLKIEYSIYWDVRVDVSYEEIYSKFSDYISDEMNDYLNILSIESKNHYIGSSYDDVIRGISLDELVSRIIMTEEFLDRYQDSKLSDVISKYNDEYMYEYIYGHTKYDTSFDWMGEVVTLYPEYEEHYLNTIKDYEGTKLAQLLTEFLSLIKENEGVVDLDNRIIQPTDYILNSQIMRLNG